MLVAGGQKAVSTVASRLGLGPPFFRHSTPSPWRPPSYLQLGVDRLAITNRGSSPKLGCRHSIPTFYFSGRPSVVRPQNFVPSATPSSLMEGSFPKRDPVCRGNFSLKSVEARPLLFLGRLNVPSFSSFNFFQRSAQRAFWLTFVDFY